MAQLLLHTTPTAMVHNGPASSRASPSAERVSHSKIATATTVQVVMYTARPTTCRPAGLLRLGSGILELIAALLIPASPHQLAARFAPPPGHAETANVLAAAQWPLGGCQMRETAKTVQRPS